MVFQAKGTLSKIIWHNLRTMILQREEEVQKKGLKAKGLKKQNNNKTKVTKEKGYLRDDWGTCGNPGDRNEQLGSPKRKDKDLETSLAQHPVSTVQQRMPQIHLTHLTDPKLGTSSNFLSPAHWPFLRKH